MTPVQVIERLLKVDPRTGRLLLGGLAVVAIAAIATSWQINVTTAGLIGLYIAGLGVLASVFAQIVRDPLLQRVLSMFFVVLIMVVISAFVVSVIFRSQGLISPPYCLVRFWESCDEIEGRLTRANSKTLDARVVIPEAIAPSAVVPANYKVFIQFAGLITRESIVALNSSLKAGGWRVQGASGERTQKAAGYNEVRFGSEADRAAAQTLADAVTATQIGSAPIQPKLVPVVAPSTLELWISN